MSLLDDAQRIFQFYPNVGWDTPAGRYFCGFCQVRLFVEEHGEGCPVRSMPKIVAALEAAYQVALDPPSIEADIASAPCWYCDHWPAEPHADDCPIRVLREAYGMSEGTSV